MTNEYILQNRKTKHPVHELILNRWSSRAMSGEDLTQEEIDTLFDAARFAPSSYNEQPWHFFYVTRASEQWNTFINLMVDANKVWGEKAGILIIACSKRISSHTGKENYYHKHDTGAACYALTLQASAMDLVSHQMGGFDKQKAKEVLELDDTHTVEAMIVVGKKGDVSDLPEDYQKLEQASGRNDITVIASEFTGTK
ncbi:MAG: nitroreductase family protein [Candidatus Woesearchaeota archaeon]